MSLAIRKTIEDVLNLKESILAKLMLLTNMATDITTELDEFRMYAPFRLDFSYGTYSKNRETQWIDQNCWNHLIKLYDLKKYMLCTEFEKLQKDISEFNFPEFTAESAEVWLFTLENMIRENVKLMLLNVYNKLLTMTYTTGGSYGTQKKKKRNNNGVDKNFILYTGDHCYMEHWNTRPTITDDLEKVCYILDGLKVPNITLKESMRSNKLWEGENAYFKIKVCKNGNTHYTIFPETLKKLNCYCTDGSMLGMDIKIKIFER